MSASTEAPPAKHGRMRSFASSGKSDKSVGTKTKERLFDSQKDKDSRKMKTHADPTLAMSEATPGMCGFTSVIMMSANSYKALLRCRSRIWRTFDPYSTGIDLEI